MTDHETSWTLPASLQETRAAMTAEWKRGLALKATTPPEHWAAQATQLRSMAAMLRDILLPLTADQPALVALVDEISTHLPDRRKNLR